MSVEMVIDLLKGNDHEEEAHYQHHRQHTRHSTTSSLVQKAKTHDKRDTHKATAHESVSYGGYCVLDTTIMNLSIHCVAVRLVRRY